MTVAVKMDPATEIQLALGLVTVFVFTTMSVVVGCWCGRKRRQQCQVEKGIPDHDNSGKQQLGFRVSLMDERKYSEANDYSEQKRKAVESLKNKRSNAEDQAPPPPTTTVQSSIPLTEDGYATLEPDDIKIDKKPREYNTILPVDENSGYEDVNDDQDPGYENEESQELAQGTAKGSGNNYGMYWEPANKEEELIFQLYSTLKLQRIPPESIELKEQLGSGQFGTVYRGLWRKDGAKVDGEMEVAVKSLGKEASEEERVLFLKEAVVMGQFNHMYIVKILGIIDEEPLSIVEELLPNGDLLHHLISLRPKEGESEHNQLAALLLSYTRQIGLGMVCLQLKQYIHRDLAARNVLMSKNGLCKIADFGLSRSVQHEDYYISHGGKIPVKWTAPEALHYRKYSTASDVWSYGCLVYEIWSLGCKPFHDLTNAQVVKKVGSGYRLPPPPGCPRHIYQIMIKCWNPEASSRPKFCDILMELQHPDFEILKWSDEDKADCSEKAMTLGSPIEEGANLFEDLQCAYLQKTNSIKNL